MGLYEAIVEGIAERAQRKDVSRWEKAREMLELQTFLREQGRPYSVAHLERLTGVRWHTIAEQLTIAAALTPDVLGRAGISEMALMQIPHSTLLRIAQMPGPMRADSLRDLTIGGELETATPAKMIDARYRRRAQLFERFRDQGDLQLRIPEPLSRLTVLEAKAHLDYLLPVLANLAETVSGSGNSYYIGVTGNGGLFVYLGPSSSTATKTSKPPEL